MHVSTYRWHADVVRHQEYMQCGFASVHVSDVDFAVLLQALELLGL